MIQEAKRIARRCHGSGLPITARTEHIFRTKFQSGEVLIDSQSYTKVLRKTVRSLKPVGLFISPAPEQAGKQARWEGTES